MKASNTTVVRFLAIYDHGPAMPVSELILGHGYMENGGLAHNDLLRIYRHEKYDYLRENKVYAGYFAVHAGSLRIFSGGSQTLGIPGDEKRSLQLLSDLESLNQMQSAVLNIFPLLTSTLVYHTMLRQQ